MLKRAIALALALAASDASAQVAKPPTGFGDTDRTVEQGTMATERNAMAKLLNFDGVYRGTWRFLVPGLAIGGATEGTATHHVGPFLGGTIKMTEAQSFTKDGTPTFNGMIVIYYDVNKQEYALRIFANGKAFGSKATRTADGYYFEEGSDPNSFRRIYVSVSAAHWTEWVEQHDAGKPVVRIYEMTLDREGPSDWPQRRPAAK